MISNHSFLAYFKLSFWGKTKRDLLHLLFPSSCLICSEEWPHKDPVCAFCEEELQYTHFETIDSPSALDKLFWGRTQVHKTFALLYFQKNSSTQKILHALKYQNKPEVGRLFGRKIAIQLQSTDFLSDIDALIPVPIHPKKRFERGYNQSEELAKGISEVSGVPTDPDFIKKLKHTGSQTRRGRFGRWDNVSENFSLRSQTISYTHIAIVDDVITTGATLEAMVNSIKNELPQLQISIISLALTK